MNRLRRLWANPYRVRALTHRLLRAVQQQRVRQELEQLSPATLGRYLRLRGDVAEHFRTRTQPRFFFDAERIPVILAATPPEGKERIIRGAQQVDRKSTRLNSSHLG